MRCPNCDREVKERARFCSYCGTPVTQAKAVEQTRAAEQTVPISALPRNPSADATVQIKVPSWPQPPAPGATPAAPPGEESALASTPPGATVPPPAAAAATEAPPAAKYKHAWYRPGWTEWAIIAAITAAFYVAGVVLFRSSDAYTYWTIARVTGFLVYASVSIAVALGVAVNARWGAYGPVWLFMERAHPLLLFAGAAMLTMHIVGLLLINFGVATSFVPFISTFDRAPLAFGILSMYLGLLLVLSTYYIGKIGFKNWRLFHYTGYIAWFTALLHGIGTGHESKEGWAMAIYMVGTLLVVGITIVWLVLMAVARSRRPVPAGAASGSAR